MSRVPERRRMAALMFTDIVGYSALSHQDEALAMHVLEDKAAIVRPLLNSHGGREIKTIGDAFFIEFSSAVEAVQCAYEIQSRIYDRNLGQAERNRFRIRIGIHLCDFIDTGDDAFGDDVNITARLEKLAEPGGICLSRQVVDQVRSRVSFGFRRRTRVRVKNIDTPISVFAVELPWQKAAKAHLSLARFAPSTIRARFGGSLREWASGALLAAFVFATCVYVGANGGALSRVPGRSPASDAPRANRVDLSQGWSIQTNPPTGAWLPFFPKKNWEYADRVRGNYRLKIRFRVQEPFTRPAVVLGLIPDHYRLYLNGFFIGGSSHKSPVEYATFDQRILRAKGENELLVDAFTQGSLQPGLTVIPSMGAFLGEYEQVDRSVDSDRVSYVMLRFGYLAVTSVLLLASFLYWMSGFQDRRRLYFFLQLLLGTMLLAYYNPLVTEYVNFRSYGILKSVPLILSGFVLTASYFALRRKWKLELLNNGLALVFGVYLAWSYFRVGNSPGEYVTLWDLSFEISALYSLLAVAFLSTDAYRAIRGVEGKTEHRVQLFSHAGAVDFLIIANALFTLASVRHFRALPSTIWLIAHEQAVAYPAILSLAILVIGIIDYAGKARLMARRRAVENLVFTFAQVVSSPEPLRRKLQLIHKGLCDFVRAERSSLYLVDPRHPELALKSELVEGTPETRQMIRATVPADGSVLGYVCTQRSPVLIRDIATDGRFGRALRDREGISSYRTGSAILCPLVFGEDFFGVLTLADRRDGKSFSDEDFRLVQLVAKDLALLVSNGRFQEKLEALAAKKAG